MFYYLLSIKIFSSLSRSPLEGKHYRYISFDILSTLNVSLVINHSSARRQPTLWMKVPLFFCFFCLRIQLKKWRYNNKVGNKFP